VDLEKTFEEQEQKINDEIFGARKRSSAKERFIEDSKEMRDKIMKEERDERAKIRAAKNSSFKGVEAEEEVLEVVNSQALPLGLRPYSSLNPQGYTTKEKLLLNPEYRLNMREVASFRTRPGEPLRATGAAASTISGKMEDVPPSDKSMFDNDFWYKNRPLLQNHDLVAIGDPTDWNFKFGMCFGFVKCAFKLTDGWMDLEPKVEDPKKKKKKKGEPEPEVEEPDEAEIARLLDIKRLSQSFGFDEELDVYAFDVKKLIEKHKSKVYVPSRVRVRLYFVSAVCIFAKRSGFVNPYLIFRLGKNIAVNMRNMIGKEPTNTPDFYRLQERDIDMPTESRFQVDLYDRSDNAVAGEMLDKLRGSTIIDLEDRWHSENWQMMNLKRRVVRENRAIYNSQLGGQNCGCLEMWVEMVDSVEASDRKASELAPPRPMEIEIRIIIWDTKEIKAVENGKTDVKFTVALDASDYRGHLQPPGHPATQATDVHYGCKEGNAIFNWRIVYPRIVMPTKLCTIQVNLYDAGLMSDTFIGTTSFDLKKYVEKVAAEMDHIFIQAELKIMEPAAGDDPDAEPPCCGTFRFELQVMAKAEANQKRAAMGREEPNMFPCLVTPTEGRGWGDVFDFNFTLPDFGLMKKLLPLLFVALVCVVLLKQMGLL
jgi:hypothetical protein